MEYHGPVMRTLVAAVLLFAPWVQAQMAFVQQTPQLTEPFASRPVLDPVRGTVLGVRMGPELVIGEWDGVTWNPLVAQFQGSAGAPIVGCAYDLVRQRLVVARTDRVTEWDGQTFADVPVAVGPESWICYDTARQAVVGLVSQGGLSRLVVWNGQQWVVDAATGAQFSADAFLVCDEAGGRLVAMPISLSIGNIRHSSEAWQLVSGVWSQLPPPGGIHGVVGQPVYDRLQQGILCVGGGRRLVGSTWASEPLSGVGPVGEMALWSIEAYGRFAVDAAGNLVWFTTRIWSSLRPSQAPVGSLTSYGAGCPGPLGVPTLTVTGQGAYVGAGFQLTLSNVPPLGLSYPYMMAGFSDLSVLGAPIPFDLAAYGMPGCALLTSSDYLFLQHRLEIGVPALPAFVGFPMFFQGAALNMLGPNGPHMAFTPAMRAVFGVPN